MFLWCICIYLHFRPEEVLSILAETSAKFSARLIAGVEEPFAVHFFTCFCAHALAHLCFTKVVLPSFCFSAAGMFAIRDEREYCCQEDFMKAARKISDNKKLETKLDYKPL